jgi:hypothetical protein
MSVVNGTTLPTDPVAREEGFFDGDSIAFIASLVFHLGLLLALGLIPLLLRQTDQPMMLVSPNEETQEEKLFLPDEFHLSDRPTVEIGANSVSETGMALSAAEILSDVSEVPSPVELTPVDIAKIEINHAVNIATALHIDNLPVRGAAGEGTTGAMGAIDRLTQDILLSLEERKTLVVWLFDQSGSLTRQREEIYGRFERIYEELGVIEASGNPAFKKHHDKPLLSSVIAFGDKVEFMTDKPTDSIAELKEAVSAIKLDETGIERVFSAIYIAASKYKKYRLQSPHRNVMLIVVSDEVGNDVIGLDKTVNLCRRYEMPVYVVGVPAPFGRKQTRVKWIDPDPTYDQTPQWPKVDQGPETFLPERVKLRFADGSDPDPIDSGFGPFALTRLCYETGGIYFAVHPNRNVNREIQRQETAAFSSHLKNFFDPEAMRAYRPDYVSSKEYMRRVSQNKARAALIKTAQLSWTGQMEAPQTRFVKRSEAALGNALTEAQKMAAKLEPKLANLYKTLQLGEVDRRKETSPRWKAGYDLAIGRVLASKVRTETYNAMLAQAKRGMKFKDEKNNTWILKSDDEVSVGSQLAKSAKSATEYLQRVVDEHPGTPWEMLAKRELATPMSWKWQEKFTDLSPPRRGAGGGNNNTPRPATNERAKMLKKPPPKRALPKL